jgi:hypothetical protein
VKIKANRKKSLPALANGQVWKTENAYIQIVELGKRLIDYRMMRQLGQSRRTQTSSIETMENYLRNNEARLVKGNEARAQGRAIDAWQRRGEDAGLTPNFLWANKGSPREDLLASSGSTPWQHARPSTDTASPLRLRTVALWPRPDG